MLTRTKPDWYAHSWIFYLSQFGMPTTVLGVKLGVPTCSIDWMWQKHGYLYPQIASRYSSLIGCFSHRATSFSFSIQDGRAGVADCVCSDPEYFPFWFLSVWISNI